MAEETPEQKTAREAAEAAERDKKTGFDALPEETQKEIKALRKEAKANREKLEAIETARAEAERKALEEQGKHKELADGFKKELDALKPELEKYRAQEKARHASLLEKLPEDAREKYKDVSTDVLEDIVTRLNGKAPATPGAKPGGTNTEVTLEQQLQAAQKAGDTIQSVAIKRMIAERDKALAAQQ